MEWGGEIRDLACLMVLVFSEIHLFDEILGAPPSGAFRSSVIKTNHHSEYCTVLPKDAVAGINLG